MIMQESPTIHIDLATAGDIDQAASIYQASAHDLSDRLRSSNPWTDESARREDFLQAVTNLQALLLHDDAAIVLARNEQGRPVGMAATMIQPPHAHLAYFFVDPGWQGRGVGRQLLDAARQHIDASGATVITLASSRDPRAWQRYLRWGLRPAAPQLPYRAAHPIFPRKLPSHARLVTRAIVAADVPTLAALDRPVRGADRRSRLEAWLAEGASGELVVDRVSGEPVGYALVSINEWWGQIGPVVALEADDFPFVLQAALAAAGRHPNPGLKPWRVDGSSRNQQAVEPLLEAGFNVESLVNWFETAPVGQWDRYLFRNEDEL